MKTNKIFMLAIAAGAMFLGSCSNDDELTNEEAAKPATMVFTATMENAGDATRTVLNGYNVNWVGGDEITIFNSSASEKFTAANISGTTCQFNGTITTSDSYYAVYPAQTSATLSGTAINGVTLPANQTAVAGSYDPAAALMVATSDTTVLSFKNLNTLIKVTPQFDCSKIILDANETNIAGTITVNSFAPDAQDAISYTVTNGASIVTLNSPDGSYIQAGYDYYIAILPTTTSSIGFQITFVATESDDKGHFGFSKSKSAEVTFARNKIVNFGSFTKDDCNKGNGGITKNDTVPCVDLGLSTGALWAKANVGYTAAKPYGDYFAWGDIEPLYSSYAYVSSSSITPTWKDGKSDGYCWSNYPYSTGSDETGTQPYEDGVLKSANDAATQKLGANWATPTKAQLDTLRTQCVWVYGSEQYGNYTLNGFKVYRAKNEADKGKIYFSNNKKWYLLGSSVNGYNQSITDNGCSPYMTETTPVESYTDGTHIFLPSSGYFEGNEFKMAAWTGYYWTSIRMSEKTANNFYFNPTLLFLKSSVERYTGRTVRGVCK